MKLLEEAEEVFCCFLTWPEPFSSVCRNLLTTLQLEKKAPGVCACVCARVFLCVRVNDILLALARPLVAYLKHAVVMTNATRGNNNGQ